jgi:methylmalonyl-CoA decarboxylase subunit alpha
MTEWMNYHLEKLNEVHRENAEGGDPNRIKIQHDLGKLTVRERISMLFDPDSFQELGSVVKDIRPTTVRGTITDNSAGDGVVMGFGEIDGRQTAVYGTDFAVMSGSVGNQGAWKIADFVKLAGRMRVPLVAIFDTAGLRVSITEGDVGGAGFANILRNHALNSGVIPQIGVVSGPCIGMMAYAASLCNFLVMNSKTAFLWHGGEKESADAGSSNRNMITSGQCDMEVDSDEEALEKVKEILSFLPQSCWEKPAHKMTDDPSDRAEEEIYGIMPEDDRYTYDMHEIIDLLVDDGYFLEMKEDHAPHIITGFTRFGGMSIGLVASNPDEMGGIFEPDSSDKYDRFMSFCDAFNIPLLTLSDTSGFVPGDVWERKGVLRHGAKLLHTYSRCTIPKVTVQLRRSYGGGNVVMGSKGMGGDIVYAWPTAEFAPTGPETVLQVVFNKELAQARENGNYDEVHDKLLAVLKDQFSVMTCARFWTNLYTVNEVIDPKETRQIIISAFHLLENKYDTLPKNKRAIKPT